MSARVYLMKRIKDCEDVSLMSPQDEQWRRTSLLCFLYSNFLVLLSTTVCSQNINKQNVNIADETITDYSFLRRYHYTKSKNYLKSRYRIRHWIPMSIGTPCITYIAGACQIHNRTLITFVWSRMNEILMCVSYNFIIFKYGLSTVKPLITNTSKEFIKCRFLHFLIMECCRYLVF